MEVGEIQENTEPLKVRKRKKIQSIKVVFPARVVLKASNKKYAKKHKRELQPEAL